MPRTGITSFHGKLPSIVVDVENILLEKEHMEGYRAVCGISGSANETPTTIIEGIPLISYLQCLSGAVQVIK